MVLISDFGVSISHEDLDLRVRIPNPVYFEEVEGLCGDNNGETHDDYRLKSGQVLPFTPLAGYQRSRIYRKISVELFLFESIQKFSEIHQIVKIGYQLLPLGIDCLDICVTPLCLRSTFNKLYFILEKITLPTIGQ